MDLFALFSDSCRSTGFSTAKRGASTLMLGLGDERGAGAGNDGKASVLVFRD